MLRLHYFALGVLIYQMNTYLYGMIRLNIPKPDEVLIEMNAKGLTAYRVAKGTGLSSETVSRFFNEKRVSVRSIELITEFINNHEKNRH